MALTSRLLIAFMCASLAGLPAAPAEHINPPQLAKPSGYTHVVSASPGKMVWISGQLAMDAKGDLVGMRDVAAQATRVFENLKVALAAAGASFDDVVKLNWYVVDLNPAKLPLLRAVRDRYVNSAKPPASTMVGVQALAREGFLIEIEAIAAVK